MSERNDFINKLTTEQKEQAKEASRSHSYIANTWTLFMMFLSSNDDRNALEALEKAREAMEVWKDFEEANRIDYPDVELNVIEAAEDPFSSTFRETMREMLPLIAEVVTKNKAAKDLVREAMETERGSPGGPQIVRGSPPANPTEGGQVD